MRWRLGEGIAAGSSALFIALIPYRSAEPQLFGRWSYLFAVVLGVVALCFLLALRELRKPPVGPVDGATGRTGSRAVARCLDLGSALWGSGYLIGSLFDPADRGRLLTLDLLHSDVPAASLLEWGGGVVLLAGLVVAIWPALARRSLALAMVVVAPVAIVVAGEGVARWMAAYRPRPTEIATASDARWVERFVRLNADGFRDRPHASTVAARTSRVLIVGGTDAFGAGIEDLRDRFAEQVASRLEPETDHLWEPIVAGVRGAPTPDQLRALRVGLRYDPEVVLLVYGFSDGGYLVPSMRPHSPLEGAAGWRDRLDPVRLLFLNSALFQEIYLRVAPWIEARTRTAPTASPYADPAFLETHLNDLRELVAAATDTGRVVAIIPVDVEIGADVARRDRYRAFLTSADSAGLPVWGVEQALRGQQADALIVDRQFRHPNASANALMAEAVATRLKGFVVKPSIPIIVLTP